MRYRAVASLVLAAATAVLGLTPSASALGRPHAFGPAPADQLVSGPKSDFALTVVAVGTTLFDDVITATPTAVAPATIDPNGFTYTCPAAINDNSHTASNICHFPFGAGGLVTVVATDSNGLQGSQQEDSATGQKGPDVNFTATASQGAGTATATIDTTGTVAKVTGHATAITVDCGNGTAGVLNGAGKFVCTYTTSGLVKIQVNAKDTTNNLVAFRQGYAPDVIRIFGPTRYETGTALSQKNWDAVTAGPLARHPKAVVLARGDVFADALAGVPLAVKKGGPLLITPSDALDPGVLTEIKRILPTTAPNNSIFVLGGPVAISPAIVTQLIGLGYNVARFGGVDRFDTALQIAQNPGAMANPTRVAVATGLNFPDALSAGPLAALPNVGAAIVLSQDRVFDLATAAYVTGKIGAGGNVFAVGGQAVTAVGNLPGATAKFTPLFGADRYATAAAVATVGGTSAFPAHVPVGIATGLQFADALTGGAFIAQAKGPILLTDPVTLSGATQTVLAALTPKGLPEVDIFGGPVAISTNVANAVVTAVNGIKLFAI